MEAKFLLDIPGHPASHEIAAGGALISRQARQGPRPVSGTGAGCPFAPHHFGVAQRRLVWRRVAAWVPNKSRLPVPDHFWLPQLFWPSGARVISRASRAWLCPKDTRASACANHRHRCAPSSIQGPPQRQHAGEDQGQNGCDAKSEDHGCGQAASTRALLGY